MSFVVDRDVHRLFGRSSWPDDPMRSHGHERQFRNDRRERSRASRRRRRENHVHGRRTPFPRRNRRRNHLHVPRRSRLPTQSGVRLPIRNKTPIHVGIDESSPTRAFGERLRAQSRFLQRSRRTNAAFQRRTHARPIGRLAGSNRRSEGHHDAEYRQGSRTRRKNRSAGRKDRRIGPFGRFV